VDELKFEEFQAGIGTNIAIYGRQIIGVFPTENDPPDTPSFYYTIGHREKGIPDLLMIVPNIPPESAHRVLTAVAELQSSRYFPNPGQPFEEGELVSIGGKFPVKIVQPDARARSEYTIQAGQFYGTEEYPVLQVLLCDYSGMFPDEPGCQPPWNIPVLRPV